jgi:DNA-binding NtrC family response regulator
MPTISIVAASGRGTTLKSRLEDAGHEVTLAGSFHDGAALLSSNSPDLLITEVQLGEFNGLHLVLRHRTKHPGLRAIAVNPFYDSVLAYEAANCGATYVTGSIEDPDLAGLVANLLIESNAPRRWPRKKPVAPLVVKITDRSARVLDLSYEGLRIETTAADDLPTSLTIVFPDSGIAVQAHRVWCRPSPLGSWWCGAKISSLGHSTQREWRHLVDATTAVA